MMSNDRSHRADHWLVLGALLDDNTFVRSPGFTGEATTAATLDQDSPLRAELLDEDGRVLLRAGLPLVTPCVDGPSPSVRLVAATVPLPTATALVNFVLDDVLIEEYRVPKGEPRVSLAVVPEAGARGMTRVAWESMHPEDVPLTHAVGYSNDNGETWLPIGLPSPRNEITFDLDALPGGNDCLVSVKTSDGIHTVTTTTDPIALPLKPCAAMIFAPEDGSEIAPDATIELQGQGYWLEERRPEFDDLAWSSSRAGALGRGADVELSGLQPGVHEITLTAGEGDRAGRASIRIIVG